MASVEFALLVALVVLAVEKILRLLLVAAAVASEEADLAIAAIEDFEFVMLLNFDLVVVGNAAAGVELMEPVAVADVTFAVEDALVELVDVVVERSAVVVEDETVVAKTVEDVGDAEDVVASGVDAEAAERGVELHDIAADERVVVVAVVVVVVAVEDVEQRFVVGEQGQAQDSRF